MFSNTIQHDKDTSVHGSLARNIKLRVVHVPGMPGTFSPPSRVSDPDMRHGTCVTHVPGCMLGSLTSGFLRSRWRRKRSRHPRRMRNPQFYVTSKRPMSSNQIEWWFLSYPQSKLVKFVSFVYKGCGLLTLDPKSISRDAEVVRKGAGTNWPILDAFIFLYKQLL